MSGRCAKGLCEWGDQEMWNLYILNSLWSYLERLHFNFFQIVRVVLLSSSSSTFKHAESRTTTIMNAQMSSQIPLLWYSLLYSSSHTLVSLDSTNRLLWWNWGWTSHISGKGYAWQCVNRKGVEVWCKLRLSWTIFQLAHVMVPKVPGRMGFAQNREEKRTVKVSDSIQKTQLLFNHPSQHHSEHHASPSNHLRCYYSATSYTCCSNWWFHRSYWCLHQWNIWWIGALFAGLFFGKVFLHGILSIQMSSIKVETERWNNHTKYNNDYPSGWKGQYHKFCQDHHNGLRRSKSCFDSR